MWHVATLVPRWPVPWDMWMGDSLWMAWGFVVGQHPCGCSGRNGPEHPCDTWCTAQSRHWHPGTWLVWVILVRWSCVHVCVTLTHNAMPGPCMQPEKGYKPLAIPLLFHQGVPNLLISHNFVFIINYYNNALGGGGVVVASQWLDSRFRTIIPTQLQTHQFNSPSLHEFQHLPIHSSTTPIVQHQA